MLECYYQAAEAHTPGGGGRALALLSRDLALSRPEWVPDAVRVFIDRELPLPDTVRFSTPPEPGQARALPLETAEAVKVLVSVLDRSGAVTLDDLFRAVGYDTSVPPDVWKGFSVAERLACCYVSAETSAPGTGEQALALLSRALAQQYESVGTEPAIRSLLARASSAVTVQFAPLRPTPRREAPALPEQYRDLVRTLSVYTETGAIGPRTALVDHFQLDPTRAFEILRTSKSTVQALERGILEVRTEAQRLAAVDRLVTTVTAKYEAAKSDPVIRKFLDRKEQQAAERRAAERNSSRPSGFTEHPLDGARPGEYRPPVYHPPPPRPRGR